MGKKKIESVTIEKKVILDSHTCVSLLKLFEDEEGLIFLESFSGHVEKDRYSYILFDPHVTISCGEETIVEKYFDGREAKVEVNNVYDYLETVLQAYSVNKDPSKKFFSGIAGYMSYETIGHTEQLNFPTVREFNSPLAHFIVPRTVIVIDNLINDATLIRNTFVSEGESLTDNDYLENEEYMSMLVRRIEKGHEISLISDVDLSEDDDDEEESSMSEESFIRAAGKCKEYIKKGHIFQIQISRRIKRRLKAQPFTIYRYLRRLNPSPFMFYVKALDFTLMGASPEILVNVDDGEMNIRPLAGTRGRGKKGDEAVIEDLRNDPKERAEHLMLVDLSRNDIGHVCRAGTIKVTELFGIEKYKHVIHMVSNVIGQLRAECSSVDAFRYAFPAGTVTGTPKVRAMEIISELESIQREFYAGGVVFFDFQNNLKSAIVIRSLFTRGEYIYTQAAAGIVSDSKPHLEYKETRNKMKSAVAAMRYKEA